MSTDFLALRLFCFNIRQHGCQISYFKLHVDGCKLHYRRPQVLHRCTNVPNFKTFYLYPNLDEVVSTGPILIWAVVICSNIYNTVYANLNDTLPL